MGNPSAKIGNFIERNNVKAPFSGVMAEVEQKNLKKISLKMEL